MPPAPPDPIGHNRIGDGRGRPTGGWQPCRGAGCAALDTFAPVPYADFQCSIDDPPGYRNHWDAEQLSELNDAANAAIHERAPEMPGPPMLWEDPADDGRVTARGRAFRESVREFAGGRAYLNFTSELDEHRTRSQYGPASHARLAEIKAQWDPEDVFHAPGHVPPAG